MHHINKAKIILFSGLFLLGVNAYSEDAGVAQPANAAPPDVKFYLANESDGAITCDSTSPGYKTYNVNLSPKPYVNVICPAPFAVSVVGIPQEMPKTMNVQIGTFTYNATNGTVTGGMVCYSGANNTGMYQQPFKVHFYCKKP